MAGRGRKAAFPKITAEDALAALRWLHALGKVTAKDIERAFSKRAELMAEIRAKLEALGAEGMRFVKGTEASRRTPATRRRRRPSAKAVAAWKTQGRYMATMRRLSKMHRVKVEAVRAKKGVEAAIVVAQRISKASVRRGRG